MQASAMQDKTRIDVLVATVERSGVPILPTEDSTRSVPILVTTT